jgi:hypothetical protein
MQDGQGTENVRFGSKADICAAKNDVRFTPNSDRKSRHAAMVMSALHLKADVCGANRYVCYGPEADIALFDHLVSALLKRQRYVQSERLGCLEINH